MVSEGLHNLLRDAASGYSHASGKQAVPQTDIAHSHEELLPKTTCVRGQPQSPMQVSAGAAWQTTTSSSNSKDTRRQAWTIPKTVCGLRQNFNRGAEVSRYRPSGQLDTTSKAWSHWRRNDSRCQSSSDNSTSSRVSITNCSCRSPHFHNDLRSNHGKRFLKTASQTR
mmetsp:Transcript_27723/g.60233  ORF Transcript_27723/g.60233 Transcript_27723/m.60233 type:complete len:168 (-) Transcript_27723:821-1324(-)